MINELHHIHHSKLKLSYLDTQAELNNISVAQLGVPPLFHNYVSQGEFSGIHLSRSLVKAVFYNFMLKLEPYLQASVQTCIHNGLSVDHSFKLSSSIHVQGRPGEVFSASLSH